MMLRNFRSAKGDGGAAGSTAGVEAVALVCDGESDALVGPEWASAPGFGVAATPGRKTMLVLTWMTDFRGDGRVFDCAVTSAFAAVAFPTDRRSPRLPHHFQKNHPEHASVTTASRATVERRK